MRDEVPELKCMKDDEEQWMPAKKGRSKRKSLERRSESVSGDRDLDVGKARDVHFEKRDTILGLYVRRGHTNTAVSWIQIKPP